MKRITKSIFWGTVTGLIIYLVILFLLGIGFLLIYAVSVFSPSIESLQEIITIFLVTAFDPFKITIFILVSSILGAAIGFIIGIIRLVSLRFSH